MNSPHTVLFTIPFPGNDIAFTWWTFFGLIGNVLFTSRVISQWRASEKAGRVLIPVSFWWMSFVATLVMMIYAIGISNVPLTLNSAVTIVPYVRNLAIHYRPDRPPRNTVIVALLALVLTLVPVLVPEFIGASRLKHDGPWFYFGLAATLIFTSRFFVQWIQSERRRESYMGLSFWYLSLIGGMLMLIYSIHVRELPFIIGFLFTVIPYSRNIRLVRRQRRAEQLQAFPDAQKSIDA